MPILGLFTLLFQVYFAVHAIRTGRDRYWIYIIIFFPGIGCLIYFFAEFLPDFQGDKGLEKIKSTVQHKLNPTGRLRALEEQAEMTPSVNNKKLLAEEYINSGMFDKAISIYESIRQGVHKNDPLLLEGLCCAYYYQGDLPQAKQHLEQLRRIKSQTGDEFDLLYARTLVELNEIEAALIEYAALEKTFAGEEARFNYAMLLKQVGKHSEARQLLEKIIKNVRLAPKYYGKTQKKWVKLAKMELG